MGIIRTAAAGYITDHGLYTVPGTLSPRERNQLRDLAKEVLAISALPMQEEKKKLWLRHNGLKRERPLLALYPEEVWHEIDVGQLTVANPFFRHWEWYLKHLIYRYVHFRDDLVTVPVLDVPSLTKDTGWGMETRFTQVDQKGSYIWDAPLKDESDLDKLKLPRIVYDEIGSRQRMDAMQDVFGDLLSVRPYGYRLEANLATEACFLRGMEQLYMDMVERPEFVHRLMDFLSAGVSGMLDDMESLGLLTLNNESHYTDSGGMGWTDELPAQDFTGKVRPIDQWGFGLSQEFSSVSPAMHEEFLLPYQIRILERFGLNAYGCCEPMTHKFAMLKRIPRLRRVSVSAWCDLKKCADACGMNYLFSWKPRSSMLMGTFDEVAIRAYLRESLQITSSCQVEVILKDTNNIEGQPERLDRWAAIAREEIDRFWDHEA